MERFRPIILAAAGFLLFLMVGFLDGAGLGPANEIIYGVTAAASFVMIIIGLCWGIFSRALPIPLRVVSGVLLLVVGGFWFAAYCYGIALRNTAIVTARHDLKQAMRDYEQLGYITNYSRHSEVWRSSNVVSIAGMEYLCAFTVRTDRLHNEGVLAVTTNEVFIWLDDRRGPKIIGPGYRPPFFPPRF